MLKKLIWLAIAAALAFAVLKWVPAAIDRYRARESTEMLKKQDSAAQKARRLTRELEK